MRKIGTEAHQEGAHLEERLDRDREGHLEHSMDANRP